jgi:NodT family efflux transporter outer membrane factor (OMF) lipoprotein
MSNRSIFAIGLLPLLLVGGCAIGPNYKRPPLETPAAYKELAGWKVATPGRVDDQGLAWSVYRDPVLDDLQQQVIVSNQNLKAAEAAYRQARAATLSARSALFPTASVGFSADRTAGLVRSTTTATAQSSSSPRNEYSLSGNASWDLDVWGRIRRSIESSVDLAKASQADLANAKLSAQAALATAYIELRYADEQQRLLTTLVDGQQRALQIAENRFKVGVAGRADVLTAKTQVEATQAQLINVGATRASLEHAIAVLVGKPPAEFTLAPAPLALSPPDVPVGLPSELLERRPDVAAAEGRMASANAQIGLAETAFFPDLTLSASGQYVSNTIGTLFSAANPAWSIGANAAETLIQGGARIAQVKNARAAYDQNVALYRQSVLTAFQDVEDNLSTTRILAQQADIERARLEDSREAERVTLNAYKAGTADFTTVITAQTARLNAELDTLNLASTRMTTSVNLIQALGGGWSRAQISKQ